MSDLLQKSYLKFTSNPRLPQGQLFSSTDGIHLLLSDGSRIYSLTDEIAGEFDSAMSAGNSAAFDSLLVKYGLDAPQYITNEIPESFPLRAISLAVAQKCNLGCTYCYAEGGDFGGLSKS